jgi:hypothetical protein
MTERDFKGIVHFQECDYLPVESQKTRQNKFASQVTKKSPRSLMYLRTKYEGKKYGSFPRVAVSSLRRGHANLLCIVPILTDVHE